MAKEKSKFDKRQQGKSRAEKRAARKGMYDKQSSKDSVSKFNVDKSGKGHISGQEMKRMARMRKDTGESRQDVINAVEASGAKLGGRAQKKFDRMKAKELAQQQQQQSSDQQQTEETQQQAEDLKDTTVTAVQGVVNNSAVEPTTSQTATNTGDVNNETDIKNEQTQEVNQDNDINTNITGDGNTVISEQDNSIRQYGGDNRSLVINGGNTGNQGGSGSDSFGGYKMSDADKAITYGTLGGFYGPDDSPAAQASFVDQQQTMNRDAQKKYANSGMKTFAKYANMKAGNVNIDALNARIDGPQSMTNEFYDRATVAESKTFGDREANSQYRPTPFVFGDPLKKVESNAADIAEGYKDDIDDD